MNKTMLSAIFKNQICLIRNEEIVACLEHRECAALFVELINKNLHDGSIQIVFRGDNKRIVSQRVFDSSTIVDDVKLFSHLFYYGVKAAHYFGTQDKTDISRTILDDYGSLAADFVFNSF